MDMTTEEFTDYLAHFTDRGSALLAVYRRDPERFKPYQDSLIRAQKHLDIAERDSLAQTSRLEDRRRSVTAACEAGVLSTDEASKIMARHEVELGAPLIADAQRAWDAAWATFWDVLRAAEKEHTQTVTSAVGQRG